MAVPVRLPAFDETSLTEEEPTTGQVCSCTCQSTQSMTPVRYDTDCATLTERLLQAAGPNLMAMLWQTSYEGDDYLVRYRPSRCILQLGHTLTAPAAEHEPARP